MTYQPQKTTENQPLDQLPAPLAVGSLGRILLAIQDGPMRTTYLKRRLLPQSPQVMVRILACAHRESALGNHQAACLLEVAIDLLVRSKEYEGERQRFLQNVGPVRTRRLGDFSAQR